MANFEKLHTQIHEITERNNVFRFLIQDRLMCDNRITRDIFSDYVKLVREHMEQVDRDFCRRLLLNEAQSVRNTADRFLSGSSEIKRIFSQYLKKYCSERSKDLRIKDYDAFVADTNHMFDLVLDRIQRETEHLYPLVRRLESQKTQPAA